MDHLDNMESLRDGIGLRGYAQRDPLVEYQKESYGMFERLIGSVESEVVKKIYRLNPVAQPQPTPNMVMRKADAEGVVARQAPPESINKTVSPRSSKSEAGKERIGRNDPCPCGSGLKYKKCGMIGAPQHRT
jgi:preprotein translocase subunit SecA